MPTSTSSGRAQLLHLYKEGFGKVVSIIDGNKNYSAVLGDRLERQEYNEITDCDGLIYHLSASQLCREKILGHTPLFYNIRPDAEVIGYGSTANNKREFAFFSEWLNNYGYVINIENIAEKGKERYSLDAKCIYASLLIVLDELFRGRNKITKSVLHQAINYTIAFVTAFLSLRNSQAKLFVVANDHSPIPVAFTMVARYLKIKDIYVQHAEVTSNFPKLDFLFSILRNKISSDIYCGKGEVGGDVVYVDRNKKIISFLEIDDKINQLRRRNKPDVVLYPSSVLSRQGLHSLVDSLVNNKSINSFRLKPHPASRDKECFRSLNVEIISDIPSDPHVAICGNSAVVVELLAKGNLVYQFFEMDDVGYDYYGFVKASIANNMNLEDAKEKFWKINSGNDISTIRDGLGKYLPSINSQFNLLEREKHKYFIHKMMYSCGIENRFYIKSWQSYVIRKNLFLHTEDFLAECRTSQSLGDKLLIDELNSVFNDRDTRLSVLYSVVDVKQCRSVVDFWIITKKIEWTGFYPSEEVISILLEFSRQADVLQKNKEWMESKLYEILCRHASPKLMDSCLKDFEEFSIDKANITKKISFIRYIKSDYGERKFLLKHLGDQEYSGLDALKIKVQTYDDKVDENLEFNFREIEKEYLSSVKENVASEYSEYVLSTYDKLGQRAKFIDVRFSLKQKVELLELIEARLKKRIGFSLIRLSDGEGYLFQREQDIFTREDAANRERHWWGQEIPDHIRHNIINHATLAIKRADVIGIPSIYRFLRDTNIRTKSLLKSIQGRGLVTVLKGVETFDDESKHYADDKVNIAIFNDISVVKRLAKSANKVIIVTSGSKSAVDTSFSSIKDVVYIPVPTHNKTALNINYFSSKTPLPFLYEKICDELRNIATPGDLVLIGAGVAGKVFAQVAKECNAVGIDIGSAMDEYVGGGIHSLH